MYEKNALMTGETGSHWRAASISANASSCQASIVYGTDAPFGWPAAPDFILNARFLADVQKEEILGGNLTKLLKLSRPA